MPEGHDLREYWISRFEDDPTLHESTRLCTGDPVVLLRISRTYRRHFTTDEELYEATRKWWNVGERRERVQYGVAVYQGITLEAFEIHEWCRASGGERNRLAFQGSVANDDVRARLRFKSVRHLFTQGAANPIKYLNC